MEDLGIVMEMTGQKEPLLQLQAYAELLVADHRAEENALKAGAFSGSRRRAGGGKHKR
jgi:hypothetical protein